MLRELTKINFEILIVIEASKDRIDVALCDILVKFDHESIKLIKIYEPKVPYVQMRKAGNCIEISLSLQLFFLFLNLHMIV